MAMPQCCYLAKGAKRPSHTTSMPTSSNNQVPDPFYYIEETIYSLKNQLKYNFGFWPFCLLFWPFCLWPFCLCFLALLSVHREKYITGRRSNYGKHIIRYFNSFRIAIIILITKIDAQKNADWKKK